MPRTRLRSRLRFTEFRDIDGITFWSLIDYPEVPEQADDKFHTVKDYERIDHLAYAYYGDAVLWPVIAVNNGLEIVPTALNVGDTLRIPSPRYVRELLFRRPRIKF